MKTETKKTIIGEVTHNNGDHAVGYVCEPGGGGPVVSSPRLLICRRTQTTYNRADFRKIFCVGTRLEIPKTVSCNPIYRQSHDRAKI